MDDGPSNTQQYFDAYMSRQINHPAHRNAGRFGLAVGGVVWIVGVIAASVGLPNQLALLAGVLVPIAVVVGLFAARWFAKLEKPHGRLSPAAQRAARRAETEKAIQEAKASGAFDQWEKK